MFFIFFITYVGGTTTATSWPGLYEPQDHTGTWLHWVRRYDANRTDGPDMAYWMARNITSGNEFAAAMLAAAPSRTFIFVILPPNVLRVAPVNAMAKHICLAQNGSVLASGKLHISRHKMLAVSPPPYLRLPIVRFTLESGTYMRQVPRPEQLFIMRATERYFVTVLHVVAAGEKLHFHGEKNETNQA